MRFHLFGLAQIPLRWGECCCPFTTLAYNMARMVKDAGHELVVYGSAGSDVPCDEFVEIVSPATLRTHYRPDDTGAIKWNWEQKQGEPVWLEHAARGKAELAKRYRAGDIALISFGNFQAFVAEVAPLAVEYIVGYTGTFHWARVFPCYAWLHTIHGLIQQTANDGGMIAPGWHEAVIPHYLDPAQFQPGGPLGPRGPRGHGGVSPLQARDGYLLFLARLNTAKGIDIAVDVAREAGIPLKVAGQTEGGNPRPDWLVAQARGHDVELLGPVGHKQRVELLQGARALLAPTRYVEAFGMTSIEAQACGTPVIASDWGGFSETVEHGVTGYLCRSFDEFVRSCQDVRIDGHDCQERVRKMYSLQAVWPQYERYFERLRRVQSQGWYALSSDTASTQ